MEDGLQIICKIFQWSLLERFQEAIINAKVQELKVNTMSMLTSVKEIADYVCQLQNISALESRPGKLGFHGKASISMGKPKPFWCTVHKKNPSHSMKDCWSAGGSNLREGTVSIKSSTTAIPIKDSGLIGEIDEHGPKKIICFNCNKWGHYASRCPEASRRAKKGNTVDQQGVLLGEDAEPTVLITSVRAMTVSDMEDKS